MDIFLLIPNFYLVDRIERLGQRENWFHKLLLEKIEHFLIWSKILIRVSYQTREALSMMIKEVKTSGREITYCWKPGTLIEIY